MRSFKKLIAGLSSLVMCLSLVPVGANASTSYLKGDVNGDGVVNGVDSLALSNFLNGKKSAADGAMAERLDVDRNCVIDQYDLTVLKRIILGTTSGGTIYSNYTTALPSQENREYYVFDGQTGGSKINSYTLSSVSTIPLASPRTIIGDNGDSTDDNRYIEDGLNGVARTNNGGTAFVIDSHTILTAAHCVVNYNNQTCFSNLNYTLYNDDGTEFVVDAVQVHVPKNYVLDLNRGEYDYALVTVKDDLSDYINFNLGVARNNAIGKYLYVTGFGGNGDNVKPELIGVKSTGYDDITDVQDYYIIYNTDTVGGDSGGPAYIMDNGIKTVIAICNSQGNTFNSSIRITTDILHFVYNNSYLSY